jgi:hypothetical protein
VKADEELAASHSFDNAYDLSQETDIIDHFPDDPAEAERDADFQAILPRVKEQLEKDLDDFRKAIDEANQYGGGEWILRRNIEGQTIYMVGGASDTPEPCNYYDGVVGRLVDCNILQSIGYKIA